MDLKEVSSGVDPNQHWYYQSKKVPLLKFFNTNVPPSGSWTVLDIGAGNGFFAAELRRNFPSQVGQTLLVDTAYSTEEQTLYPEQDTLKTATLPQSVGHTVVLLMDVLEHIEDDVQFLQDLKKRSAPEDSNHFFITVPAFNGLWSRHDVYLDHHRRYTKYSLRQKLEANGYRVNRMYYIYNGLLPLVYLKRRIGDLFLKGRPIESELKPLPGFLNNLLLHYTRLEWRILRYFKWFGLTCVAEGRF